MVAPCPARTSNRIGTVDRRAVPHRRADRQRRDGRRLSRARPPDAGLRRAQDPAHTHVTDATSLAAVRARGRGPGAAAPPQRRRAARDRRHRRRTSPTSRSSCCAARSLRSVIKSRGPGRAAPRRELRVASAAGLAAVHAAGVLHRDLKPANIMLEPSPGPIERVVLIDFGFATFEGSAKLTQQGTVVGSLHVHRARAAARRGDRPAQRSLRDRPCILFELLMGAPPFHQRRGRRTDRRPPERDHRRSTRHCRPRSIR